MSGINRYTVKSLYTLSAGTHRGKIYLPIQEPQHILAIYTSNSRYSMIVLFRDIHMELLELA